MSIDSANEKGRDFWDDYCSKFSSIYGTSNSIFNKLVNNLFRKGMKLRFKATIERINPETSNSILDMGCGPGVYLRSLALKKVKNLVGVDYSKDMLEIAESATLDFKENVKLFHSDVHDFNPKKIKKFDDIIMMGFIEYFSDPLKVLEKMVQFNPNRIFVSFPKKGGLLGWQREIRYKKRCFLKMYKEKEIHMLASKLSGYSCNVEIMSRDYFVTFYSNNDK